MKAKNSGAIGRIHIALVFWRDVNPESNLSDFTKTVKARG